MPMLFASEVGCEIAEIGFSGGLHVNMVTSDFIDITGRRGKLTDRMNHLSWKKTFKIINNNIYIKIISTKYRFFFWGGGYNCLRSFFKHWLVCNFQSDFLIKCNCLSDLH